MPDWILKIDWLVIVCGREFEVTFNPAVMKQGATNAKVEDTVVETGVESNVDTLLRVHRAESVVHVERKRSRRL